MRDTGRLPVEVEEGLWELVTAGLITGDAFNNLRALMDPRRRRAAGGRFASKRRRPASPAPVGRWSLLGNGDVRSQEAPADLEFLARQLLKRWGVVFRDLLAREHLAPPWRDLLRVYRSLEARGEIRGGRFVAGFTGEQFALPEALDALRGLKRQVPSGKTVRVSAADPLNLLGILLPGERLRPHPESFLYYRDGFLVDDPGGACFSNPTESQATKRA